MTRSETAAVLFGLLLAILRVSGLRDEAFQAVAHVFVGGCLFAWLADGEPIGKWLTIGLSVVEIICAIGFLLKG